MYIGIGVMSLTQELGASPLLKDAVNVLEAQGKTATYVNAGHLAWVSASEMSSHLTESGISAADGFSFNVSNFRTTPESTSYAKDVSSRIGGKHFIIDTARNGLGPSPDDQWCNPPRRALGEKPGAATPTFSWTPTSGLNIRRVRRRLQRRYCDRPVVARVRPRPRPARRV